MSEMADFLRARYEEAKERQARIFRDIWEPGMPCPVCHRETWGMSTYGNDPSRLASFKPCEHEINDPEVFARFQEPAPDADILADLDAKLALLDLTERTLRFAEGDSEVDHYGALGNADETLSLLARPFTGHPDYQENWAA
ncbi:DUF6221 family protein [Streptomyces sp. NBC_01498]|uniref:DUF6221 family protein n=1 Tax=Streptomyces sp. NBC_01498 TaxID=2975870 RepID=UPI002E7BCEDA|nr:DUF6221 family protein [Streptomyces sp. NBC_01498]WTL23985.1 DUF6221 family protein [Streptomyces sp. NBC_01498]